MPAPRRLALALFVLFGLFAAAAPARAEEPAPDYARSGFYGILTGNFQWENYHVTDLPSGDTDTSAGVSVRAGYRFHPRVAGEIQWEWMHDFGEDALELGDAWLLGANARVPLLTGRFQPSFLVGAHWMHAPVIGRSGTQDSFALRFGLDLEFYFTEHIALVLTGTYVQPTSNGLVDYPFGSVGGGIGYRF